MRRKHARGAARPALLLPAAILLLAGSCRPDLLVRLTTRVFHDGSLERRVEVRGWDAEGNVPDEEDWLAAKVGLRLAEPDAWTRVERGRDRITAEGFFSGVEELPSTLSYSTDVGRRVDRVRTELRIEEKAILKRWSYREFHGDPFSRADSDSALDTLVELLVEALESELHEQFGEGLDTRPAAALLRTEGRALAQAMISVGRRTRGVAGENSRVELWTQVLAQHGVPAVPVEDPDDFWKVHVPLLIEWSRGRIAAAISTPDEPVSADALLAFWPDPEEPEPRLEEWARRTWGGTEAVEQRIAENIETIAGYYGRGTAPRFRFEVSVRLPGTLLSTSGAPDGNGAWWLIRNEDMTLSDFVLRADSAEILVEPLVALGARREFDVSQLARMADLLWRRDPEGVLAGLLAEAVRGGGLRPLRDEATVPDGYEHLARELADLLDPDVDPVP